MIDAIQKKISRKELADYLATLAEQIRDGKIASEEKTWSIPGEIEAKIQRKEKKGRIELKINCRWSTLADYAEKDREKIVDWHVSMKKIKKRMGTSFKQITKSADGGKFPEPRYIEELWETSRLFAETADPEWQDDMDEYMDHLENFMRAIEGQQFEVMLHEIRDLHNRMKGCHKEYK
ncbi:GAK system XXXCH domain-containing protein [Thermodesulfobacteriota bacterium]